MFVAEKCFSLDRIAESVGLLGATPSSIILSHPVFRRKPSAYLYACQDKFHAYSDIKVNTETVSRKKKNDYQRFTLYPGNEGSKHHRQSTGVAYA
jgi:hypothetical protein